MALKFEVGNDLFRTVNNVVASPDALIDAARPMARSMVEDLREYFAVVTTAHHGKDHLGTKFVALEYEGEYDGGRARTALVNRLQTTIRSRMPRRPERDIQRVLQGRLRRWDEARDRLITFVAGTQTVNLATRCFTATSALVSWEYLPWFHYQAFWSGFDVNPFTWFTSSRTRTMRFSSERARIAMSATVHMLHELSHALGCISGSNCDPTDENDVVVDVDRALQGQGIGLRVQYLGGAGQRTYLDSQVSSEIAAPGSRAQPNREWVEFPSESILERGS